MEQDPRPEDQSPPPPEDSLENLEPQSSLTPAGIAAARRIWRGIAGWQDSRIWIMLLGRFITATAFSLFFPFLAIYLHVERDVGMGRVGVLYLVIGLAGALSKVHGGVLADRYGRRIMMALALFLRALTFLGLAHLVAIGAGPLWIGGIIVLSSYGGHFFIPAAHAMIADLTRGQKRVDGYGLFRVATNLGWAVGPLLGGKVPLAAYPWLLLGMAATYLVVGAVLLGVLTESRPSSTAKRVDLGRVPILSMNRPFLKYCLAITLIYTVMGQMMGVLSVFAVKFVDLTNSQVGNLFFVNGMIVVLLQVPLATRLRRARMTRALFLGSILYGLGYGIVGFAATYTHLMLAIVVITFGEMIVQPAGLTLAAKLSPEDQRGRYLGVFGLFNHLGWSIGPMLGGLGLQVFAGRPWVTWAGVTLLAVIAGVAFLRLRRVLPEGSDRAGVEAPSSQE